MRLNIDVFCLEQLLPAFPRQRFHYISELTATVISLARVTLRVLIREYATRRLHHSLRSKILAGDQFNAAVLPPGLILNCRRYVRVCLGQTPRHQLLVARSCHFGVPS